MPTQTELTTEQELRALCQMAGIGLEKFPIFGTPLDGRTFLWKLNFDRRVQMNDDFTGTPQPSFHNWHAFITTESALAALRSFPCTPQN